MPNFIIIHSAVSEMKYVEKNILMNRSNLLTVHPFYELHAINA